MQKQLVVILVSMAERRFTPFLSSGSFVVDSSAIPSAEVVVVAGGGGGAGFAGQGWGASGGGGALSGMVVHPGRPFAASTTYPITIGSGGVGGQGPGKANGRRWY